MKRLLILLACIFTLSFARILLVPECYLTIQQAVISASDGDTISVNFGHPNGKQSVVCSQLINGKTITFEVRGEGKEELLEMITDVDHPLNINSRNQLFPFPDSGWQGQGQVNDSDTLFDDCWGFKNIIFDTQNRAWVFWGGRTDSSPNIWAYYTYWDGQGWTGDSVAIALPGPERWDSYAHRATLGLDNQPYLVCDVEDPSNLDDIYYTRYNGSEWSPKRMVNLPDSTELDFQPHIASNGNQMWVNWFGGVTDTSLYNIYVSSWNGNGWNPEEVISSEEYHNWFQNLAVDRNGNPYVVWIALDMESPYEDVIFYRHHDGSQWLEPETVMKGMLLYQGSHWSYVNIGLDEEDNPYVVFDAKIPNELSFDIFFSKKENGIWTEPTRLTNDEYNEVAPMIAISNSCNLWTAWSRKLSYYDDRMIARRYDGQNWSPEMIIPANLQRLYGPRDLAFDHQGRLWVIYSGIAFRESDMEIWYDLYSSSSLEEMTQNNKFKIGKVAPMPFSSYTAVSYHLIKPSLVEIEIFDKIGKLIKLLERNFKISGTYTINWDGKDQNGRGLPEGIYFISLKLDERKEVIPIILIK